VTRTESNPWSCFVASKSVLLPEDKYLTRFDVEISLSFYKGDRLPLQQPGYSASVLQAGGWNRCWRRINPPPVGLAGIWIDLQKGLDAKELAKEVAVAATMNVGVVMRGNRCLYKRVARWVAAAPTSCLWHILKSIHVASSVACWSVGRLNDRYVATRSLYRTHCLYPMLSFLVRSTFNNYALCRSHFKVCLYTCH